MRILSFLNGISLKKDVFFDFKSIQSQYDIILHIGLPKTGTSALQNFFLLNRKFLYQKGLYYPKHDIDKNGVSGGHSILIKAFQENRFEDAQEIFESWYQKAKKVNKILLLSSEGFFYFVDNLKPLLKDKRVLVIAYHRDILEYIVSIHNQSIKRHFNTKTLKQTIQKNLNNPHVGKNILQTYEKWERLIDKNNLIVRNYKKESFYQGRIEKDFIYRLGLDIKDISLNNEKINISYVKEALELKRMINYVLDKEAFSLNHKIDLLLQAYSQQQKTNNQMNVFDLIDKKLYQKLNVKIQKYERMIQSKYIENYIEINRDVEKSFEDTSYEKSLVDVKNYLISNKEVQQYLLEVTSKKLKSKVCNYAIFKLAELLEINFPEEKKCISNHWFTQVQLEKMSDGKYKEVDFLREIAIILLHKNEIKNAKKILERALELRPNAPKLLALYKSVCDKEQ